MYAGVFVITFDQIAVSMDRGKPHVHMYACAGWLYSGSHLMSYRLLECPAFYHKILKSKTTFNFG